jgi:transposase
MRGRQYEVTQDEIREYCRERPGITNKELADHFGMHLATMCRRVARIKSEWRARDKAAANGHSPHNETERRMLP